MLKNLGFQSMNEADLSLKLYAPKSHFGFIVDFCTIMEHIHLNFIRMETLSNLGRLYMLSL